DSSITSALLYIETPGTSSFYLDNVKTTVDSVGDAVPVTGISLDKDTLTLDKGEAATLNATVSPANADNKSVTWSSSDTNVATVVNGVVTAVNAGTATITAKTVEGNLVDTCNVTVNDNIALSIDKSYLVLQSIGASSTLNASVGEGITWSTSDPSVATVNNGVITAIGLGKVTITASLGNKSASCSVLVVGNVVYYKDFSDNVNPFIEWPNNVSSGAMQNGGTLTAANGYLTVAADAGYKGPGYKFTNTVNKTYKIYARVKNAGSAANQQVQFIDQTSSSASLQSYTINNTNWTLIEYTAVIAANSNKIICLTPSYNNGTLTYYVDDFLIVDVTGGDQQGGGEQPGTLPNLNSFYIANNASFDSSGKVIYLDSTNYQNFAKSTNSDSALLNKFTTWSGIRDVVKGIEYTVTINQATAVSGSSIKTNVLIQNKKSETWGGSYKNFTEDTGVSSVSGSAITITKTILFDNVSWSASDTEAGKIQLTLSDIYTSSPVSGTVTFKVIPKESAVPYFTDFYAAQNKSFDLSVSSKDSNWSDVYLNKENFKGIASGSGISDTELLDKFTTWGGVKEVVKQYEISVTIDSGKALSDNLQANILVQNQKTNDGWNGSYKQYPVDATVSTVSGSSITLTKTIVLSNETWDASDNYLGKISLQFKNADASVPLKGTWSIKVVANNKN
ncbi:MAG TPA: Ig-like domain-containing protein, partial [Mobilitalea sp.]|nr:Ig-like domain-containing protein [Mobilitalea sp.]